MVITAKQIAVLEDAQWRRFEDDTISYLRECFGPLVAQRYAEETDLRAAIRGGVERGRRFGILNESDCTRFLAYECELVPASNRCLGRCRS